MKHLRKKYLITAIILNMFISTTTEEVLDIDYAELDEELDNIKQLKLKEDQELELSQIKHQTYLTLHEEYPTLDEDTFLLIDSINTKFNLPHEIVYRLIYRESAFDYKAKSNKGAEGLMQVMPTTFDWINDRTDVDLNKDSVRDNVYAGLWYLDHLKSKIKGSDDDLTINDWKLILASYNAGYSRRHLALKSFKETKDYVKFILNS